MTKDVTPEEFESILDALPKLPSLPPGERWRFTEQQLRTLAEEITK